MQSATRSTTLPQTEQKEEEGVPEDVRHITCIWPHTSGALLFYRCLRFPNLRLFVFLPRRRVKLSFGGHETSRTGGGYLCGSISSLKQKGEGVFREAPSAALPSYRATEHRGCRLCGRFLETFAANSAVTNGVISHRGSCIHPTVSAYP